MTELLLATRNPGKLRELREIAAGSPLVWRGLAEFPAVPDAVENGRTFADNARLKALHYASATGLPTLADDSGLEVDYLGGAPGVLSARYAGAEQDAAANVRKLLAALAGVPAERRTARFRCSMAFARPGEVLRQSAGVIEGRITDSPRGTGGFGYDPVFLVPALGKTAAELSPQQKHAISHRGQALRSILPRIEQWVRTSGKSSE
jgi:XTP/dITP diphosphohydrolase